MRVFLFTTGMFPASIERQQILDWVEEYSRALQMQGIQVNHFNPYLHRITERDCVHVFGYASPQNWYWLRASSAALFVSPFPTTQGALETPPQLSPLNIFMHRARKKLRPQKVPMDNQLFLHSVDKFYLFEPKRADWPHIAANKIELLPKAPAHAAEKMSEVYCECAGPKELLA